MSGYNILLKQPKSMSSYSVEIIDSLVGIVSYKFSDLDRRGKPSSEGDITVLNYRLR